MSKKQMFFWYEERIGFFGHSYFKEYADILTLKKTKTEVDFLEKELGLKKGVEILDLACGHGRHTIELAKRGYIIIGQDANSFFLHEAKKFAKKANIEARWIKGDMRQIPFENKFDIVINLFTSFGYFEREKDNQKVLHQVAKALRPNGKFVIDVANREYIMRIYKEKESVKLVNGTIVNIERKFDLVTGCNQEKRTKIYKNKKREVFNTSIRVYALSELINMCEKANLQFVVAYGNYDKEVPTINSKRCILITKKMVK